MSQIDDRIVALEFDNKQFESGAKQSLNTIEQLKDSMKFDDMSKNLSNFSKNATKSFDLSKIQSGVDALKDRFSATGIAGMEVIKRLTNFALDSGKKITSTLAKPFEIMWTGGKQRAANIDNAKFQLEGLGVAWENLYEDIDYAVAGTAYGLDAAAVAASQLTASGVGAGDAMKKALRGISGVAAMTNSTYEEISPIFTTVAGQGKLMTMQLRQLESRGLNAAAELGKALGKTEQQVREMVTKGQIDFKTFADAMDSAFGDHAKDANKTFEGALGNMQFALKKIGAEFAAPLREAAIPFFNQIRLMINEIKNGMSGIFPIFKDVVFLISNRLTVAVSKITDFLKNDFTGAKNLANGLSNIVQIVLRLSAALVTAFREVFGSSKSVGDTINGMAEGFESLTERLIPSNETLIVIKNTIATLLRVIKTVVAAIKPAYVIVAKVAGVTLKIIGVIASLIIKLAVLGAQLFRSSALFKAMQSAGGLLSFAFEKMISLFTSLKNLFSDGTTIFGRFASTVKNVASTIVGLAVGPLFIAIGKIIETIGYIKNNFPAVIDSIKTKISDFIGRLKQIPIMSKAFENIKLIIDKLKIGITAVIAVVKTLFSSFSGESTRAGGSMSPIINGMTILTTIGSKLLVVLKAIGMVAGGAFLGLVSVFNTVMSVVKGFNIGDVISKIAELVSKVRDLELVKTAIEAFRNSGGNLIVTFQAVIAKVKEFFASLRESGVSVFDFFIEKIKNVVNAIKEFFSSFGNKNSGDELTRSIEDKSSILDTLMEKFIKVKDVVSKVLAKMRDEGLLTKVLMVAYVGAILKALIQIPSSIHRVSKSLTGEDGLFTSFKGIAKNVADFTDELRNGVKDGRSLLGSLKDAVFQWGQAQKKSKIELLGGLLRDIAISIGILAASLGVLSLIPADNLERTAWILGIFSGVLIALAAAVTYASKTDLVSTRWFSSLAANMLAMTISIGILGALLVAFSKVKIEDVDSAIGILIGMMGLMVVFGLIMRKMAGLDFSGTTLRSSIFMLAFALSLKSLVKTLSELSTITITDPTSFMIALIGAVGSMAVLIGVASAISPASALAVVSIVWALGKILQAMKEVFANINFNDFTTVLIECKSEIMATIMFVSAMMTIMSIAITSITAKIALAGASIGKGLLKVGVAFMAFGMGLLMIQSAIKKMSKLDLLANDMQGLKNVLWILGSVIVSFGVILGLTKWLGGVDTALLKIAGAIALLSIAMFNISVVAHIVKNLEAGPIFKAIGILVAIMGSMAIMVLAVKSGNGTLAFKTVLATVLGFTLLIGALIVLGLMCDNDKVFADLGKALALIVGIMLSMALVLMQVSKINTGQSWKPILAMVVMLGAVFGALYLLSQNVHSWQDIAALGAISGIILGTIWGLIALTKSLTKFAKEENLGKSKAVLKSIAALGVMLGGFLLVAGILGTFVYVTKGIEATEIMGKALAIIGVLALLVICAEKMTKMIKDVKMSDFGKFAGIMGAMILAFAAVAAVVYVIGQLDFGEELLGKVVAIGLVMAELVALSILMGKFGKASMNTVKAIGALALLSIVFGLVAGVCAIIGMLPMNEGLLAKTQVVMLVLTELIALNTILGYISKNAGKAALAAVALVPLVAVFAILSVVCGLIGTLPMNEGLLAKTQIVILVLVELAAINVVLGMLLAQSAMGAVASLCLIPMITIFGLLGVICSIIGMIPSEGMLAKTQTIVLVLVELVAINTILGMLLSFSALGAVASLCLIPMIAIFGLLALVCAAIGMIPTNNDLLAKTQIIMLVLVELAAINALLGVLVLAAGVATLGAIGAICLIPLIAIFGLLAIICTVINTLPIDGVQDKIRVIMNTLWEMVGMLAVLGIISPLAALAMLAIPGILAVCAAMLTIVASLKLLEGSSVGDMQAILDMITGKLWELVAIGAASTVASIGLVALGAAILMMGVACLAAGAGVEMFAAGITSLASTTPQQMANLQTTILTFCNSIAVGVVTIITSAGQAIVQTIVEIITAIKVAIFGGIPSITSSSESMGTSLVEGFKLKAMEIIKIPADLVKGLVSGIAGIAGSLIEAGRSMGAKLVDGFRAATGWHSPPEFIVKFFNDAGVAVNANAQGVTDLFEGTGNTWGTALKTSFDNKVKDWNFSNLKDKGLSAVNNLTAGLKMGEGGLLSEVNFLNGIMGQLANGLNLAAKGFQTSLSDYEYQLKMERKQKVSDRNAIDYTKATKAQQQEYIKLNNQVGEYDEKLKAVAKQMGKASDASAKLDLGLNNVANSAGKAGGAAGGASKEMKNFAEELGKTLEGQMDIFKKFEKKEAMSKDELLENMRSQIRGMTEWATDMQVLAAKGLDQGLYEKLAMMGPQGAEYVGAFKEMTAAELAEANQLWAQSLVLPNQVANQVAGAFSGIGSDMMAGWMNGINANGAQVADATGQIADNAYNEAAMRSGVASPSWMYADIGMYMMMGLANGISAYEREPVTQISQVCSRIYTVTQANLKPSFFQKIGKDLLYGLAKGLKDGDGIDAINEALEKIASIIKASKSEDFEENSPSKITEDIGRWLTLGLAKGILEEQNAVANAMTELSDNSLDMMRDTISLIGDKLADEVGDPVITPVLDLSNVQQGMNTLSNMFSATQALNASASLNSLQNEQSNQQRFGTTFIQNNYSPKALSRTEIYRQTKNQFSAYREAFS